MTIVCKVMKVNRSSYYAWQKRGLSKTFQENKKMAQIVKLTHAISQDSYGARRHADELSDQGFTCGRSRAKTVMKIAGVEAKQKRKYKATTDSPQKRLGL